MSADFSLGQFWDATPEQRVKRCRLMAALATNLAASADSDARRDYINLAKQWNALADEMEAWNTTNP
jgi:hypothetical protein